ncbi:hypothetical protein GXW74_13845 [Roseomonas eburnea]|uniref:Rhamnan synthesis protein F n=1 Tax=Neoroseomonas eburnea TaxID=1346889 RepID=A0A9X9XCY8_9PROT|nr:rhamnan synthesis F family protein [Neoroseomonas eburnea]MBR0681574.1 hypothetical protein [Neoroseomonas eburnea]
MVKPEVLALLRPDGDAAAGDVEVTAFSLLGQTDTALRVLVDLRALAPEDARRLAVRLADLYALPGAPPLEIALPDEPAPRDPGSALLCRLPAGIALEAFAIAALREDAGGEGLRLTSRRPEGRARGDWLEAWLAPRAAEADEGQARSSPRRAREWRAPARAEATPRPASAPQPAETVGPAAEIVRPPPMPPELLGGLALPLAYPIRARSWPRIAVLIHLHYAELGPEFREHLRHMPGPADLYVTTDTQAKRAALQTCFGGWHGGSVEIRVVPNRGRDVAPRIVGLAEVHRRYDLCLHLHGKRSTHWARGEEWRRDLLATLLGSPGMVAGTVEAFARWPRLGIILPRTWPPLQSAIDWGWDFLRARALAARMNIDVSADQVLDFPAGSMFWSRGDALRPLLDLDLKVTDFEAEDGLPNGSLAHAIERLMLHVCEKAGYHWLRIGDPRRSVPGSLRAARSPAELDEIVATNVLRLTDPVLNPPARPARATAAPRLRFQPDRTSPPRLTLLARDIAGRSHDVHDRALPLLARMSLAAGEDLRIRIAAEGGIDRASLPAELAEAEVMDVSAIGLAAALPLARDDVLLATCWRSAAAALHLREMQADHHGLPAPPAWFLPDGQDAPEEFRRAVEARAGDFLVLSHPSCSRTRSFPDRVALPPIWDPQLPLPAGEWSTEEQPLLLVDWRPSLDPALRDAVQRLLEGWASCDPIAASRWRLLGLGEAGQDIILPGGALLHCRALPAGAERAALLRRGRAGILPPWGQVPGRLGGEMAAYGLNLLGTECWPADAPALRDALASVLQSPRRMGRASDRPPPPFVTMRELDSLAGALVRRVLFPNGTREADLRAAARMAPSSPHAMTEEMEITMHGSMA